MRSARSTAPVRRDQQRSPARQAGSGPIHAAGSLGFTESVGTREEVWDRLGVKIRERVNARIGQLVEWWASDTSGRNAAVVLGTKAFVTVEPTINAAGGPAHEIRALRLDESTFRRASVIETVAKATAAPSSADNRVAPGSRPGAPVPTSTSRLGEAMSGFLGNLPARAQQLLQEPFVDDHDDLWHDYYYFRPGSAGSLGGTALHVWCYLADKRYVTFAAGVGHGYRQGSGPSSWELTCWRAEVLRNPR
ncbi:hypothetical protein FHS29_006367 [Saccharothrix tamanrassetensis]|uniref:Uncharacterized protein n=1 Tax=Saccharothrix tamanrassetensis TaxID=1051531 RepID=A0A841CWK4_9PSEU|nr:hypothetical protein [Saccharothrix tamanrassetensis]MBB5959746.1 hypothetical protein [Saccharothrix tamanrassetensis]